MDESTRQAWESSLDQVYNDDTFLYSDSPDTIFDSSMKDDSCEFKFDSRFNVFLGGQLLIGELTEKKNIIGVEIILCDSNENSIFDSDGNPILYMSRSHDFGHLLDIVHQSYEFTYVKCRLTLQANSNFDLHNLFFHCARPLPTSSGDLKGMITGKTSFSVDSMNQTYRVSIECPSDYTCKWCFDNKIIFEKPDVIFTLILNEAYVGNRTLSYVAYRGSIRRVLALLQLFILSSKTPESLSTISISSPPTTTTAP
ncbi:hypothetical protein I4U23_002290 [Adineta vaga]|nr:hypothetical protein I4U23_002290 [Adineta vaga]